MVQSLYFIFVLSLFGLEQRRSILANVLEFFKTVMELLYSCKLYMIYHFIIELENKELPCKIYYYRYETQSVNNSKFLVPQMKLLNPSFP